jgi:hypothetical protein
MAYKSQTGCVVTSTRGYDKIQMQSFQEITADLLVASSSTRVLMRDAILEQSQPCSSSKS